VPREIDGRLAPHRWGARALHLQPDPLQSLPVRLLGPSASWPGRADIGRRTFRQHGVAAVRRPGLPSESNSADLLGAWRRSTPARSVIAARAAAAKYGW